MPNAEKLREAKQTEFRCSRSLFHGHMGILLTSFMIAVFSMPVQAQSQTPPSDALKVRAFDFKVVVEEVRQLIRDRYVLPERRPALDAVLSEGLTSGRYAVTDGNILAERINADLERVGQDRHLVFRYAPREALMIGVGSTEKPGDNAVFERLIRRANHGVTDLRLMPGNVRLMTYDGFHWIGLESAAALQTAMRFLAGGDAVIIDLRGNGGGTPEAVQYIISRFLPAGKPLTNFYMNGAAFPKKFSALASPADERLLGKPLYVLTSGGTGSAAEEFVGHVAGYNLGEIVGENTAGAAFRSDIVSVSGQFVFSISVGRGLLASTGKDWEGVGHAPSIKVTAPAALDKAHAAALRTLVGSVPADEQPTLNAVAEAMEARALGHKPNLPLTDYVGIYGERALTTDGVRLYSKRGDGALFNLIPLGGHRFAVEATPAVLMVFEVEDGAVQAMTVEYSGGPLQPRVKRSDAR